MCSVICDIVQKNAYDFVDPFAETSAWMTKSFEKIIVQDHVHASPLRLIEFNKKILLTKPLLQRTRCIYRLPQRCLIITHRSCLEVLT